MFILDSLMVSGIRWVLDTVVTAAEAERNDDTALREQLLEAEMRREMGEITDEEFGELEAELLARIREIKERREGAGPLAFGGAQPLETSPDTRFQIEASVSGDFYDPGDAPHTTVIETTPTGGRSVELLDMKPGDAAPPSAAALPLSRRSDRSRTAEGSKRSPRTSRTGTDRTTRTGRTSRTTRTTRTKA
jgi:hypothetical protein